MKIQSYQFGEKVFIVMSDCVKKIQSDKDIVYIEKHVFMRLFWHFAQFIENLLKNSN